MGKKSEKIEKDWSTEREKKLAPVARELVKIIINADLPIGSLAINHKSDFDKVAQGVIQLMLDNKVNYLDKEFLFQLALRNEEKTIVDRYTGKIDYNYNGEEKSFILGRDTISSIVMQPFQIVQSVVVNSLNNNFNKAINKILNKDILDVTINDIDDILKIPSGN